MKGFFKSLTAAAGLAVVLALGAGEAQAQFTAKWIDIGEFQHAYIESGARNEVSTAPAGWDYPAIRFRSTHMRAEAFWIGVKNWKDPRGDSWPYYTTRIGPRESGQDVAFPVENKLISKWEDTEVTVDGVASFDKIAVVDAVDPNLPADRVIETTWNMGVGISAKLRAFAYSNAYQDNYHIVEYTFTNTGNTDDDPEIELPNQTLNDTYFYWIHRWRTMDQEAWVGDGGQVWGKYSMVDVVGDGHADYPVDFTAYYIWHGFEPGFTAWNNLGGPLVSTNYGGGWSIAAGDTVGRLAGGYFDGEMVLYAPNSTSDPTYDKKKQPYTIGFMDQDEKLTSAGASHQEYYEDAILTRERQTRTPGISPSRMWPHYADRIEPSGKFWEPKNDPSSGRQGGHAATVAYGPYTMKFGESVKIVLVRGIGGLSFDAQMRIGRAYKLSGNNDTRLIEYDANGDGTINKAPFDYGKYLAGSEAMTKNQWVMTSRDSLFKTFYKARALYQKSSGFTQYPIPQPPLPPKRFEVFGKPDKVELRWEAIAGGPARVGWEVYRTSKASDWSPTFDAIRAVTNATAVTSSNVIPRWAEDELPYTCVRGNRPGCKAPALPATATSFDDTDVIRGTDYYYYLVAVGEPQAKDPMGVNGTPGGAALRSSRYYTQTYQPVNLKRPPFGKTGTIEDARVVPNPVNLGSDQSIRFAKEDEIAFFNIPGECTIKIYSETGELIKVIEHTNGSGDEKWNLTTEARQLLVSGIYIAVIETPAGERVFRKFTVIR